MLTARHIRDNENKQAVDFLEKRIELEVISFTNKGRQVHELSPREYKILKAVKVYRDKKCSEKCLKEISYILDKL